MKNKLIRISADLLDTTLKSTITYHQLVDKIYHLEEDIYDMKQCDNDVEIIQNAEEFLEDFKQQATYYARKYNHICELIGFESKLDDQKFAK